MLETQRLCQYAFHGLKIVPTGKADFFSFVISSYRNKQRIAYYINLKNISIGINLRYIINGYCHLVGCGLICWIGLLDGLNQQCWQYIDYVPIRCFFWTNFKYRNLQFWTILLCYKKCYWEVNISKNSMLSFVMVFLSLHLNYLT